MNFNRYAALAAASGGVLGSPPAPPPPKTAPADAAPTLPPPPNRWSAAPDSPTDTIVANAAKASTLTTLVSAVQAAGLAETLCGAGPFTVFAPDNAAFEKVPAATRTALMAPAGKDAPHQDPDLSCGARPSDRRRHCLAGPGQRRRRHADDRPGRDPEGRPARTTLGHHRRKGGTSTITQADVAQSNGMVHVIDTVLMPN